MPDPSGKRVQLGGASPGGVLGIAERAVLIERGGDAGGVAGQGVRVVAAGEVQQHRFERGVGLVEHAVRQPVDGAGDDVS